MIKTEPLNLSMEEFETLSLIYAAHEDLELSHQEVDFIQNRYGNEVYNKMFRFYCSNSEYRNLEIITSRLNSNTNPINEKNRIMSLIQELFGSDGDYSKLEIVLYKFLNRIIVQTEA